MALRHTYKPSKLWGRVAFIASAFAAWCRRHSWRVAPPDRLGDAGEELAVQYLRRQGYQLLQRNYRCRFGEIDLIAQDGRTLAFIEVKTRRSQTFGPAAAAVTSVKQRHLLKAAQIYLVQHRQVDRLCRFDVVTITLGPDRPQIELIKDAFQSVSDLG